MYPGNFFRQWKNCLLYDFHLEIINAKRAFQYRIIRSGNHVLRISHGVRICIGWLRWPLALRGRGKPKISGLINKNSVLVFCDDIKPEAIKILFFEV